MKIIFGVGSVKTNQKDTIKKYLSGFGNVIDVVEQNPTFDEYVKVSQMVSGLVQDGDAYGVLMCGTGTGTSIVANKHKGIHAARCVSCEDAEDCKLVNNANVLCISGKTSIDENLKIIKTFFTTHFKERPKEKSYRAKTINSIKRMEDKTFK